MRQKERHGSYFKKNHKQAAARQEQALRFKAEKTRDNTERKGLFLEIDGE